MDQIEQRLKDATDKCLKSHSEWASNKKDSATREVLMESVHELRKVAARLEIEIAISERDEMAAKPIPIPPHRANRKQKGQNSNNDDNIGNSADPQEGNRSPRRKKASGNSEE